MNSGLQCLSNVKEVGEYFLKKKYTSEINESNLLGSGGNLVKEYGLLVQQLWYGNRKVVNPSKFRESLIKFSEMVKKIHS